MMENFGNKENSNEKLEVREIIESLWERLPDIASDLIKENLDMSDELNQSFLENPDDVLAHKPNWHQWGIITHTKMFEKAYREEVPEYLEEWGLREVVEKELNKEIDGFKKGELLEIAIVFHDLGKFTDRKLKRKKDGSVSVFFVPHEEASGRIVRSNEFSEMLKRDYDLTEEQIEYIARCAELHYEISTVRNNAINEYTLEFAGSDEFKEEVRKIIDQYPDFALEIGLLYLADSLGKTDIRIEADTLEEIEARDSEIRAQLKEREIDERLVKAIKQLPVNIAVVRNYLNVWKDMAN